MFILGNKQAIEKWSPEGAPGRQNPPGRTWLPGAPWWPVPTRVCFLVVSYFPNFCYIPKLTKNIFADFLESVYLPYHISPLFSQFWSVPKGLFYMFFRCQCLDNITFNINGHTSDIMFYSLSINNLRVSTFGTVYFDSARPINLLHNIGSFPFE